MKRLFTILITIVMAIGVKADAIDSLESLLRDNPQIQEKIYIHTDNSCYFIGDTLWYKAYVLRSDNLTPTNLSKLLYVELLSPDGIVVERQHIVISDKGVTCGQFALCDSLYSGYYELRAYTKWNLNFNVEHKYYNFLDERKFYSKSMCADFFRDFQGLYSRVLPIYSKPKTDGDWGERYMFSRPKQRVLKQRSFLVCKFFPEGGQFIEGVKSRVAFELTDNNGQAMDITGKLADGSPLVPSHMGKGVFEFTPTSSRGKAQFVCDGKTYSFDLPKAVKSGVVINYSPMEKKATYTAKGVTPVAFSISCRGAVARFERLTSNIIDISTSTLPSGINEIILYDADAQPLASRLMFINNEDMAGTIGKSLTGTADTKFTETTTANPYERIQLNLEAHNNTASLPKTVSVAVYDRSTYERGYDDGNILSCMLLSGDLRGFVAYPAYYFESNDEEHTKNLDLLLMVQGWRKYKRVEKLRYLPERGLTYEGIVLKLPSTAVVQELEDLQGIGNGSTTAQLMQEEIEKHLATQKTTTALESNSETGTVSEDEDTDTSTDVEVDYAVDDVLRAMNVKKSVYVEAELSHDGQVAGVVASTDKNGRFKINLPPYYDQAVLFVKAYAKKDSLKKCLTTREGDKGRLDERAFPDYYVKRDMFFPVYSKPYSWYQQNSPNLFFVDEDDDNLIPETSRLAGNHTLQTVVVSGKRRGSRAIDYSKPALVRDAYALYNDVTDYGLSPGVLNFNAFPYQVATLLYGNMGRAKHFNVRALREGTSFYRNYTPLTNEYDKNCASSKMFNELRLSRMQNIRAYTDYELRTDSGAVESLNIPDVTLVFEPVADEGKRYTYRDRRYILDGITYPEEFYSPNYSDAIPTEPKDYRRTLYWNPNAVLDEEGKFTDVFFNNSKESRLGISATGVSSEGILYW